MRLLLWHDTLEISARWQAAFGLRGHDVRRARSEDEAMELLRHEPFDLLIFDLMVGGESGLAVALLAEFHQPEAVTILVSDQDPELQQDLFARLGNLRAVQGAATRPEDLVAIAERVVAARDFLPCSETGMSTNPHGDSSPADAVSTSGPDWPARLINAS